MSNMTYREFEVAFDQLNRQMRELRDRTTASSLAALSDDAFEKQRTALEKEARALGNGVSSLDVLRHAVERALARLLSNPRLVPALEARLRSAKRDVNAEGGGR